MFSHTTQLHACSGLVQLGLTNFTMAQQQPLTNPIQRQPLVHFTVLLFNHHFMNILQKKTNLSKNDSTGWNCMQPARWEMIQDDVEVVGSCPNLIPFFMPFIYHLATIITNLLQTSYPSIRRLALPSKKYILIKNDPSSKKKLKRNFSPIHI